jgi:hypothetical protein
MLSGDKHRRCAKRVARKYRCTLTVLRQFHHDQVITIPVTDPGRYRRQAHTGDGQQLRQFAVSNRHRLQLIRYIQTKLSE